MITFMIKSSRILIILAIVMSGGWLVREYSMHYAQAEIVRSYSPARALPELNALALDYQHAGDQRVVVNGQTLHYRRAHWAGSPESLLDQIEKQMKKNENSVSEPGFSHAGDGWFFFGRLPDSEQAESRGFMIKAVRQVSGTEVWIWDYTDSTGATDYNSLEALLPQGLSPLPGSLQLFSSEDANPGQQNFLSGYSAPGSVMEHVIYYRSMLEQAGYKALHPVFESPNGSRLLQYKNGGAEISITISASPEKAGQSIDIVQLRKQE